ncbi:ROK family protein [Microbacterium marinilacus]|uniref:ROK family protein n=1 Tax=Microbacterium marinilacus TaxID=415209 RepID=A0ABP7BNU0_9MICO|nr:ROK family protein [Microbacterium marinilacus]MBY0690291.1 ROK family protein [Microbacterium marinilacus]
MSAAVIGVDVGGTTVKAVAVADGRIVAELRRPTPSPDPTGSGVVETVADAVAGLTPSPEAPVGVVVPGIVDEARGVAVHAANLGWRDVPLRRLLGERLGREVAFGHDVRAGALAEARLGAARAAEGVVAFVPIGTGIAAALLVDGRPIASDGWAGEIGQPLIAHGPHAGRRVEEIASAAGTAARAGLPDARAVVERVRAGDPASVAVWRDTVDVLADALTSLVAAVSPRTVVLGGGLALAGDTLLVPLADALRARMGQLRPPRLVTAALGDRAAALGAALLATDGP